MFGSKAESNLIEHLMRRAGFGATPDELKYYKQLGFEATVEELLNPERVNNDRLSQLIEEQNFDFTDLGDLKRWWIYRMSYTRRPLEEKMTLFWHGHFATSNAKVGNPYLMYQQNQLLRKYALGNFKDLLLYISQDPAMIIWLDNAQNRKAKPNENYAREVMELFTLGIGNYTEPDVKEAARAFTGWQAPNGFYFNKKQHDFGDKEVLGVKGPLNGDDVVALLSDKAATARHLASKLITYFSHDDPENGLVNEVADVYLSNQHDMRAVMREILTHKSFRSDKAYHCKIKSPVDLVVGTVKTLQVKKLDGDLPAIMARMGQNLFEPPNVKGWDGGLNWIATDTMMERFNFAARIATQKFDAIEGYISPTELANRYGLKNARQMTDYFLALLVDNDVPDKTRAHLVSYVSSDVNGRPINSIPDDRMLDLKMRGLIHLIMTLPSYQLA